jgi:enoyl-CoA hydratase
MTDYIIEEKLTDFIVFFRINRPDVYNTLSFEMLEIFGSKLDAISKSDVRCLVITGMGKSFSSGADLKEMKEFDPNTARNFSLAGHRLLEKIENFPCPVIAAVNGYAVGGGLEMACACDLRFAAESAKFGLAESKVGMITSWGGTFRLPRHIGVARAKELFFTARMITATEAKEIGLVNDVYPDERFMENVFNIARRIEKNAPIANRLAKKLLNRYPWELDNLKDEESLALSHCVNTEDQREAISAYLEKREPVFKNR